MNVYLSTLVTEYWLLILFLAATCADPG